MDDLLPASIGAQMAQTQQRVALSMLKQTAQMQQQIANMVQQGADEVSASARGQNVDLAV